MATISVQPQLAEAEKELAAQETALMQQLEDIRGKRKGLQTVIALFGGQSAEAAIEAPSGLKTVPAPEVTAKVSAKVTQSTRGTQGKTKKVDGRAAAWQRYIRDDYKGTPLPDVVVGILRTLPESSFKIADIMAAIFREDMPKTQFLKARNRISNILSGGARNGDWYRGHGIYSLSKKAIKAT